MTKNSEEHGLMSLIQKQRRTNHKDFQNCLFACFLSQVEPKKVDLPYGKRAIRKKWVYKNKKDKRVARIEAIRLFLAYALFMNFVVYQMDVKSAFLYGKIKEEVYVCQPPGAWYETLSTYLLENRFHRGTIDKTLSIKKVKGDILLVQVYVDDIIFGSTKKELCTKFEKLMHKKFQMSSMDELSFFLGLSDIMFAVCACARFQVTPKVSHLHAMKRIFRYFKCQPKLGLWYPKDSPFDLEAYSDSNYAGASLDRKSITRGCQFLGSRLISWQCKKQTIVANSTTESEYVAAANCCG
ncbi:putative ribonuclease H-like domain-containing protein [Tanacetum coccineum]